MKRYLYTLISLSAAIPVSASEIHYSALAEEIGIQTSEELTAGHIDIQPAEGVDLGVDKPWELQVFMSMDAIETYIRQTAAAEEITSGTVNLYSIADDDYDGSHETWENVIDAGLVGATVLLKWEQNLESNIDYTILIQDTVIGMTYTSETTNIITLGTFKTSDVTTNTNTLAVTLSGYNQIGNSTEAEEKSKTIVIAEASLGTGGYTNYTASRSLLESSTEAAPEIQVDSFIFPDWVVVETNEDGTGTIFSLDPEDPINPTPTPTASVPEPATATLSLLALAGLAARRRRR